MKVSIVIVNYNNVRFLSQAIQSALAQSYRNTEVIVIDDGSTDESAEVIRSYGNLIIPIFKNNGGQSSCYFRGLALAGGDLVLYLDSDDYLHPNCLSEVIDNWKEGCAKAHFYLDVVDEHGARLGAVVPSGRLGNGTEPLKMMRRFGAYCSPPASGNIYNRAFLTQILTVENELEFRHFDSIQFGADSVPILAAPYFGTISAIPRILGCYRRHNNASGGVTSAFQAQTSLHRLEKEHQRDLLRDRAWRLATGKIALPKMSEPSRLKRRFCYLRLAGHGLEPADNRLNLVAQGIFSTVCWGGYSCKQKIAVSSWFLGMALLPLKVAQMLIHPALGISNRSVGLRKFLRPRTV
jgi:glycosyltransferase involved in cell wall biosynthesis